MSVLLPLKYLLPTPGMLLGSTDAYRSGFGASSRERLVSLEQVVASIAEHRLNPAEWEIFLREFSTYQVDKRGPNLLRDGWSIFLSAYNNPAKRYRDLFISMEEKSIFPGIPHAFLEILHDVLRDGTLTEAEERYLEEKRLDHRVPAAKLQAITRRRRQMNPAFLQVVMEVCRDGVITPNEKSLLLERAEQCSVDQSALAELIEHFLGLAQMEAMPEPDPVFSSLVGAEAFVRYVLKRPVLSSFITSRVAFFLRNKARGVTMPKGLTRELSSGLVEAINDFTGFPLEGAYETLPSLMARLCEVTLEGHPEAPESAGLEPARDVEAHQTVLINGLSYHLQTRESRDLPLFTHEVQGTHVYIVVNTAHPFLGNTQREQLDLAFKIALSATVTQLQKYADSTVLEHFFQDLHVHDPAIERQYAASRSQ